MANKLCLTCLSSFNKQDFNNTCSPQPKYLHRATNPKTT